MRNLLSLLFVMVIWSVSPAQKIIVKNKTTIGFTFSMNVPMGQKEISGVPTLMANMKSGNTFGLQFETKLLNHFYAGVAASRSNFGNWQYPEKDLYNGTQITLTSAAAMFTFRTEPKMIRSLGKLNAFFSVAPGVHAIKTKTDISSGINSADPFGEPLMITSTRPGIACFGGINYVISGAFEFSVSVGYSNIPTKSKIYTESSFSFLSIQGGLFYRLKKDKHYRIPGK